MSRRTILIIDDEQSQRDSMRRILSAEGYGVLEAADYHEALAVQQSHPGEVDLLLIDLILPGGNGYELFRALLAREPHLRVLFVSGQAGAQLRKFLDSPVPEVQFLRKPFEPAELLQRVKTVLELADPFANAASGS
jgi:two-component system, cell cycle sensor histidine kinase and response regulator CckA